jgi:splicing factor 3A subunit 1
MSNPYRKYYEMRIAELKEGKEASQPSLPKALLDLKAKDEEKRKKREERKMLGDGLAVEYPPPRPFLFVLDHPPIAFVDSEIIKITAQFVARNGDKFLQGLMTRESRNPQFEFLLPEHHLYSYFDSLVNSNRKVLQSHSWPPTN